MKKEKRKIKVFLFNNEVAPYRLPLFEALSMQIDLKVFFGREKTKWRKWNPVLDDFSFNYEILAHFDIKDYFFNYNLPLKLLSEKFDLYILSENARHFFSNFTIALSAKIYRKPFIIWSAIIETEYLKHHYSESAIKKIIFKLHWKLGTIYRSILYPLADFFVAYSESTKDYLVKTGIPDYKITFGTQVMPEQLLPKPRIEKSNTKFKDKTVILYLGYLLKRKGVDILIKAYKKLKVKDTVLIIAGSGEDEVRLRSKADNRKDIYFVGHVKGNDKAKYYTIADIFVLPSFHDEWGLVVNEAMYYGLPVIITESIGAVEIVDKIKNGFIVKPNNADDLFLSLDKLARNHDLRKKMSVRSKSYKGTYMVENAVSPFIEAINKICK